MIFSCRLIKIVLDTILGDEMIWLCGVAGGGDLLLGHVQNEKCGIMTWLTEVHGIITYKNCRRRKLLRVPQYWKSSDQVNGVMQRSGYLNLLITFINCTDHIRRSAK